MEPAIHVGDAVLVRSPDGLPSVGEVITFRPSESTGLVTHRVVRVDGGTVTTKGDANDTEDTWLLDQTMIVGDLHGRLPSIGYVLIFLRQPTGVASVITLVVAICMLWRMCFPLPLDSKPGLRHARRLHHPDLTRLWSELTDALEATTRAIGGNKPAAVAPAMVDFTPDDASARVSMGWSEDTLLTLELLCAQLARLGGSTADAP
jgi:signal peptidase I